CPKQKRNQRWKGIVWPSRASCSYRLSSCLIRVTSPVRVRTRPEQTAPLHNWWS
ncbi:hypothetical protein M9458_028882, partial [Cirrhinus mrigala]